MTSSTIELWSDQELPSTPFAWSDGTGALIDFSSGWTFRLEVSRAKVIVLDKTTGITGSATSPNVIADWTVDEIKDLAGMYAVRLIARRTADSKDRVFPGRPLLYVTPAPTPAA